MSLIRLVFVCQFGTVAFGLVSQVDPMQHMKAAYDAVHEATDCWPVDMKHGFFLTHNMGDEWRIRDRRGAYFPFNIAYESEWGSDKKPDNVMYHIAHSSVLGDDATVITGPAETRASNMPYKHSWEVTVKTHNDIVPQGTYKFECEDPRVTEWRALRNRFPEQGELKTWFDQNFPTPLSGTQEWAINSYGPAAATKPKEKDAKKICELSFKRTRTWSYPNPRPINALLPAISAEVTVEYTLARSPDHVWQGNNGHGPWVCKYQAEFMTNVGMTNVAKYEAKQLKRDDMLWYLDALVQ